MEAFLSFIFITILVLWLAGQLGRWLLRRWIARKQREFAQRFGDAAGGFAGGTYTWSSGGARRQQSPKKEGEIKVQMTRREAKKVSGQVGEYVEYEEEVIEIDTADK